MIVKYFSGQQNVEFFHQASIPMSIGITVPRLKDAVSSDLRVLTNSSNIAGTGEASAMKLIRMEENGRGAMIRRVLPLQATLTLEYLSARIDLACLPQVLVSVSSERSKLEKCFTLLRCLIRQATLTRNCVWTLRKRKTCASWSTVRSANLGG